MVVVSPDSGSGDAVGHAIGTDSTRIQLHALESLVGARRRSLGVSRKFGDDALGYFTERLDPATRHAAAQVVCQAKRNKPFQNCTFVGLALDGTTARLIRLM
jgi:hypothetical protein